MKGMPAPDPGPDGRDGDGDGSVALARPFPLVLLVLGVSTVVIIATNGLQLLLPASDLGNGRAWGVRVAGAATAAAGLVGLIVQRKRLRAAGLRGTDPTAEALRTAAIIMGVLTLIALVNPPPRSGDDIGAQAPFVLPPAPVSRGDGAGRLSPPVPNGSDPIIIGQFRPVDRSGEPVTPLDNDGLELSLIQWVGGVLAWILLAGLAVVGLLTLLRRLRRRREMLLPDIPLAPADADASLEASLGDVTGDGRDPRWQITSAYQRLLTALAAAGALREPYEAPHEHLHRALGPLGVRSEPLHRLAGLYVLAQFGGCPVTEGHRAVAADALENSLADLRKAHRSVGSHGTGHVPEEANA